MSDAVTTKDFRETAINDRVQARFDALSSERPSQEVYQTIFRIVHEELALCANESYTRGMVDQHFDPLPHDDIERLNDGLAGAHSGFVTSKRPFFKSTSDLSTSVIAEINQLIAWARADMESSYEQGAADQGNNDRQRISWLIQAMRLVAEAASARA